MTRKVGKRREGKDGDYEVLSSEFQTITVFKPFGSVRVFGVASNLESELVLQSILETFVTSLTGLLNVIDTPTILSNLEMVMLLMDEMIDGGKILEVDTNLLTSRVLMREGESNYGENEQSSSSRGGGGGGGGSRNGGGQVNLADLTIGQALKQAREQLIANMGPS